MIKTCAELIDENKEYTKRLGFKVTEKEKTLPFMYCIFKMDKNPIGQVSSQHLKFALQSKSEMLSDVGGRGVSECSGRLVFIFLFLKTIGFGS